jgi:hypothetical protein
MCEADDAISWSLNKSGLFTTKLVYEYLESGVFAVWIMNGFGNLLYLLKSKFSWDYAYMFFR